MKSIIDHSPSGNSQKKKAATKREMSESKAKRENNLRLAGKNIIEHASNTTL